MQERKNASNVFFKWIYKNLVTFWYSFNYKKYVSVHFCSFPLKKLKFIGKLSFNTLYLKFSNIFGIRILIWQFRHQSRVSNSVHLSLHQRWDWIDWLILFKKIFRWKVMVRICLTAVKRVQFQIIEEKFAKYVIKKNSIYLV